MRLRHLVFFLSTKAFSENETTSNSICEIVKEKQQNQRTFNIFLKHLLKFHTMQNGSLVGQYFNFVPI